MAVAGIPGGPGRMERQGGTVTPETLTHDVTMDLEAEVEELLVEEVSIDGLCGVY